MTIDPLSVFELLKGGKRDIYEGGHRGTFLNALPNAIKARDKGECPVFQTDYLWRLCRFIGVKLPE